jgi:hypothetical protein
MAEGVYFSNAGTLTVAGSGGTPSATAVSAIQNVKIEPRYEIAKAYGWGSILRQGAAQYNFEVDVSIEWIKWDPTKTTWLGAYFLNYTSPDGTVEDTNTPATFSVVCTFTSATGTLMKLTISDVIFKNMPIDAKMGEWVRVNLEGSGSNIVIANA